MMDRLHCVGLCPIKAGYSEIRFGLRNPALFCKPANPGWSFDGSHGLPDGPTGRRSPFRSKPRRGSKGQKRKEEVPHCGHTPQPPSCGNILWTHTGRYPKLQWCARHACCSCSAPCCRAPRTRTRPSRRWSRGPPAFSSRIPCPAMCRSAGPSGPRR